MSGYNRSLKYILQERHNRPYDEVLKDLLKNNPFVEELSEIIGFSPHTVSKWLRRAGITYKFKTSYLVSNNELDRQGLDWFWEQMVSKKINPVNYLYRSWRTNRNTVTK